VWVKADVSVTALTKYAESKGVEVEFKGGLFAANIKLQELLEKNELEAIKNMGTIINEIISDCFDYEIEVKDPQNHDGLWRIEHKIEIRANRNFENAMTIFYNTLLGLYMKKVDRDSYNKVNKKVYEIVIGYTNGENHSCILRSEASKDEVVRIIKLIILKKYSCTVNNGLFSTNIEIYFPKKRNDHNYETIISYYPPRLSNEEANISFYRYYPICYDCYDNRDGYKRIKNIMELMNFRQYYYYDRSNLVIDINLNPEPNNGRILYDDYFTLSELEKIQKFTVEPYKRK
jgi:hypothetical protein